jgi:hypothetical protein
MISALRCSILEPKDIGNCSNNGISSQYKDIILIGVEDGNTEVDELNLPDNACQLVKRVLFSERHDYIVPCKPIEDGNVGYMASGCYVTTSDTRFQEYTGSEILPLFDRQETQRQYDTLSK